MFLKTMRSIVCMTMMSFFALKAHAQYSNNWGTGMYGASQSCPYQVDIGDDATSVEDDIAQANDDLKDLQSQLEKAKREQRDALSAVKKSQRDFERYGFKADSDVYPIVETHISSMYNCADYKQPEAAASGPVKDIGDKPAHEHTDGPSKDSSGPFTPAEWSDICHQDDNTLDGPLLCSHKKLGGTGYEYSVPSCSNALRDWQKHFRESQRAKDKALALAEAVKAKKSDIAELRKAFKEDVRQHLQDAQQDGTEGGCYECMLSGNAGTYKPNVTNTVLDVAGNLIMGLGSMYYGNQMNKTITQNNAALGYPTAPVSSFGFGYPYFMGAAYGAIGGGGMAGGSFGCGSSASGGGYASGPAGMMGPYGQGGMYGPQGGAMGYPANMYGSPYGGGMFNPGMGPWGTNGPWGLGNSMGNPMSGMMNPYGMQMGMQMPYGMQMGMQMPMGMQMGMQMPYGMQMGMQMPMGMQMGMAMSMGIASPYGMQMGMQMPYGMQMGMQMPYGMQMGMAMSMGIASPYGMQMGMQMPYGMQMQSPYGMQSPFGMGSQYQYMQAMQMAQYQKQEANYMAGQQILSSLGAQMSQLMQQMQQVQMSMYSGGTLVPGMLGGGGGYSPYSSGGMYSPYSSGGLYSPYSTGGGASYLPGVNGSTVTTPTGGIPSVR
jgi:hypothetical protein